jgi:hypothetical protein
MSLIKKTNIGKHAYVRTFINIFIQVIFPNMIKYLYITFKEEQKYIILLNWCKFYFVYQVSDAQTSHKNANRHHA